MSSRPFAISLGTTRWRCSASSVFQHRCLRDESVASPFMMELQFPLLQQLRDVRAGHNSWVPPALTEPPSGKCRENELGRLPRTLASYGIKLVPHRLQFANDKCAKIVEVVGLTTSATGWHRKYHGVSSTSPRGYPANRDAFATSLHTLHVTRLPMPKRRQPVGSQPINVESDIWEHCRHGIQN
ncbi:hypothetical protein OKW50_002878 [Paraburkholderia youngii]